MTTTTIDKHPLEKCFIHFKRAYFMADVGMEIEKVDAEIETAEIILRKYIRQHQRKNAKAEIQVEYRDMIDRLYPLE